ncbi:putative transcription factor interactor and regulator CCHC(Zn) family [Helianthus anomalus]
MTKEDYDQVDLKRWNLWIFAGASRVSLGGINDLWRLHVGLEGHDMKLGFDKVKVTCFECKQKGHFKRECSNRQADVNVNPFHDDYYKKAIYHCNNEKPSRKQIEEGSPKEKKQAMITIHDESSGLSMFQDDNQWKIQEVEGLREIPRCREKVEERINNVIYASLEKKKKKKKKKKKTVEEIVVESQKLVKEVKKEKVVDEKLEKQVDEAAVEKQQVMVDQEKTAKEAKVPNTKVKTQSEYFETLNQSDHKTDEQCKKCMETCKACTEKDDNLRSRDIEFTKI